MTRPLVTLKLATSLDGRIATSAGESRWITGPEARAEVQRLRAACDAVLIGAGTARVDDPELLARTDPPPQRQPMRVVLDTRFSLTPRGRLFATLDQAPVVVIGAAPSDAARRAALEAAAVEGALAALADLGVARLLAEGGGQVAASLIGAGVVDRIEWFRAPLLLGGEGRPSVGALAFTRLADAPAFRRVALRELGPDLWESYERA